MKTLCRSGSVFALLIANVVPSHAQSTVLANIFGPGNAYNNVNGYSVDRIQQFAEPFSTGSGIYRLSQIDVAFFDAVNGPTSNSLILSVETSGANGLPSGTALESFTFTNISASTILNAVSVSHPTLSNNQTYWIVAAAGDSTGTLAWNFSPLPITALYANNDGPGTSFRSDTGTPAVYRVTATPAVPEPSSLAVLGLGSLGLVGLVLVARRKRTDVKASSAL